MATPVLATQSQKAASAHTDHVPPMPTPAVQPGLALPPLHSTARKRKPGPKRSREASSEEAEDPDVLVKRQRNKAAAKKYRQKKLDRIQELELEVAEVQRERDGLLIRLARQEAETAALREMLKLGRRDDAGGR